MSSSYHIEWKKFIKVSGICNIQKTEKKAFLLLQLLKVCALLQFRHSKKKCFSIFWPVWVFFAFLERYDQINTSSKK